MSNEINTVATAATSESRGVIHTQLVWRKDKTEKIGPSFMSPTKALSRHLETRRLDDAPVLCLITREGDEAYGHTEWFCNLLDRKIHGKLVNGKAVEITWEDDMSLIDLLSQPLFS